MYYGLSLKDNPKDYNFETNMQPFVPEKDSNGGNIIASGKSFFKKFISPTKTVEKTGDNYWISMQGMDRSIFFEVKPSPELMEAGLAPQIYREDKTAAEIKDRNNDQVLPLGKSPVNVGIWFDATKISDGDHMMGFRIFFENVNSPERLAVFKSLGEWIYEARRI
jgi:hypothetical protein